MKLTEHQRAVCRAKTARWRAQNRERSNEINRASRKRRAERGLPPYRYPPNMPKLLEWQRKKRAADCGFRVKCNLRSRISRAVKGMGTRAGTTMTMVGCTVDELRKHIESKWLPGMSWDNYTIDGWHIDHIRPCDSFDLTDPAQQRECFHYTNLQPLWAADNYAKGNRI